MTQTKQFCKHGHDTHKTGRYLQGRQCKLCQRLSNRQVMRKLRRTPIDAQRLDPLEVPNLRQVRKKLGLTQKQLAALSGVSKPHISSIERGTFKASSRVRDLLIAAVVDEGRARKERGGYG